MKTLISANPHAGTYTELAFDESENKFLINNAQDVEPLIEANKIDFNTEQRTMDGLGRKVASIPMVIWMEIYRSGITRDKVAMKRWLNDPDNKLFRTSDETV